MSEPSREYKRLLLFAYGWTETIYGTYLPPGVPWFKTPWKLEKAYERVSGKTGL